VGSEGDFYLILPIGVPELLTMSLRASRPPVLAAAKSIERLGHFTALRRPALAKPPQRQKRVWVNM
jgi:hypothetical protein